MTMRHFTIQELTHSDHARANNINNTATATAERNLTTLTEVVLDPVRTILGRAININSGYRSKELNTALRGSRTSQHMKGEATDLDAGTKALNKKLFEIIKGNLPYDQLINEHDYSWIHVSYRASGNRKQTLKIG